MPFDKYQWECYVGDNKLKVSRSIMRYFAHYCIRIRTVVFIVGAMLCSLYSKAQSDPAHTFLNITEVADVNDETTNEDQDESVSSAEPNKEVATTEPRFYHFIFLDYGNADLTHNINGYVEGAHGQTGAFSWQAAYRIKQGNDSRRMFLSAGLEVRNINTAFTIIDPTFGITQDKLQFWYLGVPVMFQYVNTHHTPGTKNDVNCYFQLGMSVGYKVLFNHVRTDGFSDAPEDNTLNYNKLLLQPFISAGISYTTQRKVCLLGPFYAYSVNNINTQSNITDNFSSYGIRLSVLLFK